MIIAKGLSGLEDREFYRTLIPASQANGNLVVTPFGAVGQFAANNAAAYYDFAQNASIGGLPVKQYYCGQLVLTPYVSAFVGAGQIVTRLYLQGMANFYLVETRPFAAADTTLNKNNEYLYPSVLFTAPYIEINGGVGNIVTCSFSFTGVKITL